MRRTRTLFDELARHTRVKYSGNYGFQIEDARKTLGLSQTQLAQWVREKHNVPITQRHISDLEQGQGINYQAEVCETLGIPHPEAHLCRGAPDTPDDKPAQDDKTAQMGIAEMQFLYTKLSNRITRLEARLDKLEGRATRSSEHGQ